MKILVILLSLTSSVYALPNPAPREKPYDLLKCTSSRFGTIWASFGHVMNSTDPKPRYFFTEISLIEDSGALSRARFWGPEEAEAAQATVTVGRGRMRLEFSDAWNGRHKVSVMNTIRDDFNSFMGNWEKTIAGVDSRFDQVACTAL